MSKIAFIYPGQGAQKAGMGADFYEKMISLTLQNIRRRHWSPPALP